MENYLESELWTDSTNSRLSGHWMAADWASRFACCPDSARKEFVRLNLEFDCFYDSLCSIVPFLLWLEWNETTIKRWAGIKQQSIFGSLKARSTLQVIFFANKKTFFFSALLSRVAGHRCLLWNAAGRLPANRRRGLANFRNCFQLLRLPGNGLGTQSGGYRVAGDCWVEPALSGRFFVCL